MTDFYVYGDARQSDGPYTLNEARRVAAEWCDEHDRVFILAHTETVKGLRDDTRRPQYDAYVE